MKLSQCCRFAGIACLIFLANSGIAQPNDVSVVTPSRHEFNRTSIQPATASAFYEANLHAQVSGYVSELFVDIGDSVTQGQVLAHISVPNMQESLNAIQASVTALQSEHDRVSQLVERGAVTAQTADETLQRLDAARAELRRLQVLMDYGFIKAPFDGVISERHISPGDVVFEAQSPEGMNQPLFKVAVLDVIRVVTYLPEKDAVWLDIGDSAYIVFDALPGRSFASTVSRKANSLDPYTRSMAVEIDLPNSDAVILPGLYGRVEIALESHQTLALPAAAVQFDTDEAYVYVVGTGGRVQKTIVSIGIDDGVWLEISSGLSGGERVVNHLIGRLSDGEIVNVVQR